MRALHIVEAGEPLVEATVATPAPAPDEVVVRIRAAGICRTDVHYRRGPHTVRSFPMTPGHEIAGEITAVGGDITSDRIGERVAVHYQTSCGSCRLCRTGREQFCPSGDMIGRSRHGGYAEFVAIPARNAYRIPDNVSMEHAAVMMCSSATSFHAIELARLEPGERVAVFGCGGLGMSAIQLALARGASEVYAIDVDVARLSVAQSLGGLPVNAAEDVVPLLRELTDGEGIDVALELIGLEKTMHQAVQVVAPGGRTVVAGIGQASLDVSPLRDLVMRQASLIGVADHLGAEIPKLLDAAARGDLSLDGIVTSCVRLSAEAVNDAMDRLEGFGEGIRTVIVPHV